MDFNFDDVFDVLKGIYDVRTELKEKEYEDIFFKLIFKKLSNKKVYIDSNIFLTRMNKAVDRLFNELSNYSDIIITMPKEQYEEIYNLKSNDENPELSLAARNAFRTIEKLFDSNNLEILNLEDNNNKKAYADPVFIKDIINNLKKDEKVFFLTEDKDLRIRLKSKIKTESLNEDNITVDSFLNIYSNIKNLVDSEKKRIKELKEDNKVIDEILNPGLGRRMIDKALDKIERIQCG